MSDIRSLLESIDKIQLNELSQADQRLVDAEVEKISKGSSTYADVEKGWDALNTGFRLPGSTFNNSKQNHFLGDLANKLGVVGMYNPDKARMGGIVLAEKETNSTRYKEIGTTPFSLGLPELNVAELAKINMLPPEKLERAKQEYPENRDINPEATDDAQTGEQPSGEQPAQSTSGAPETSPRPQTRPTNPNIVKLENGQEFDKTNTQSQRLATQAAQTLYRRYQALVRKVNESAPVSMRGYLKEYGLYDALFEELSMDEQAELQQIYRDLNALIDSGILSDTNTRLYRDGIADAPQVARDRAQTQGVPPRPEIQATELPPAGQDGGQAAAAETPPPEAQAASDASRDQGARVEPGEGGTSSSLERFASSGKGGLANDADETAAIKELQEFLNELGFNVGTADERYGRRTIDGVKEFQRVFGARVDGDAGPETIGKIVTYRNDLRKMDELIAAAGSNSAQPTAQSGAGDEAAAQRAQTVQETFDFRKLINIAAGKLFEALNDQQRTEAQALITKYEELVGRLPEPAKTNVQQKIDALKAAMTATPTDTTNAEEPIDTRTDAAQAADPDRDGNADDPEAQVFAGEPQGTQVTVEGLPEGYKIYRVTPRDFRLYGPDNQQIGGPATGMANNERILLRRAQEHAANQGRTAAAQSADPTNSGNATDPEAQTFVTTNSVADINRMPVTTTEERLAFFNAVMGNSAVFNRLTDAEKQQIRQILGRQ